MTDVLVVGMAALDFVFRVPHLPTEAGKYRAEDVEMVGGGCAANAAVAIARCGGRPTLAARLGADPLADIIIAELEREGVDTSLVDRAVDGRSSYSAICVDGSGERQIVNYRGAGLTGALDWAVQTPRAAAVLADTRWPAGAAAALDLALGWGVPGILDAEAPIDHSLLFRGSHLAFSRPGLASVEPGDDLSAALARFAARFPGWACVTDGANGVWFTGEGGIEHIPAFRVPVKDTLAAGDVWHGTFALALAEGVAEAEAIRFANAAAALKCMTFGGRAGAPDRTAVRTFLEETP